MFPNLFNVLLNYINSFCFSAHQCDYAEKEEQQKVHFMAYINIDALEPMLQVSILVFLYVEKYFKLFLLL